MAAEAIGSSSKQLDDFRKNIKAKRAPKSAINHYWASLKGIRERKSGSHKEIIGLVRLQKLRHLTMVAKV
jgi:hypothetical protein